jgi:HSP20 family protein
MTTIARRRTNPVTDVLNWLEAEPPVLMGMRGFGLAPYIRIEDFVEDGTYVLRAEMPGIDPEKDVEVEVIDDVLTIRGERREEDRERNRHEFHYGSFERSLRLPRGTKAEAVKASYADGVLELRIPADVEEPQSTRIPVQRAGN